MSKPTKTSVTCFLYHDDHYLFLKRNKNVSINPGQLNGIGGKLAFGEDYLSTVIRETREETGYQVSLKDIKFCGIIKFESKDREDWITCFFRIKVPNRNIPIGNKTKEGELIWLHKDKVLISNFDLVEDLYYIFKDIVLGKEIFFLNAQVTGDKYKIIKVTGKKLKIKH